jgi:hypothetical protein
VTYYYTRPGDKVDFNGRLALDSIYKVSPRLTIRARTSTAYLSQPDVSIIGGTNRSDGDYLFSNTGIGATYQWSEKFSTETAYDITVFYYVEDALNDTQGRVEQNISQSGRWLVLPTTTAVLEYRANPVTYFEADLNSFGNFFLIGGDFQFNPRLSWIVRTGAELRFNNNPVDGSSVYIGPFGESRFRYQFGPASDIAWFMRYGTEASGITDVTERQTFRTGININHAFTARISAAFSFNYLINYYDQPNVIPDFYENIFETGIGVSFQVNRALSLTAGYQFTADVSPTQPEREYNRSVAYVGLNLSF